MESGHSRKARQKRSQSNGRRHKTCQSERTTETDLKDHPFTRGLPDDWMHAKDELYDRLRGPTENVTVLATAYSDPEQRGTGRHEPMMLAIQYGQGRFFHTAMGHTDYSIECVGFITTFCRGVEWAATSDVTQAIPSDFHSAKPINSRKFE